MSTGSSTVIGSAPGRGVLVMLSQRPTAAQPLAAAIQTYGDHLGGAVPAGAISGVFELSITRPPEERNSVQPRGHCGGQRRLCGFLHYVDTRTPSGPVSSPVRMSRSTASSYGETVPDTMGLADAPGFQVRREDLVDLAFALAVAAVSMVGTLTGTYGDRYGVVLLLDLAVTLPLALRRRAPLLTFLTVLAMIVARALLLGDLEGGGVFFSLIVGAYSLGAHAPLRRALVGISAFVPAMMCAAWLTTGDALDDLVFLATLIGGFWLAGRVVWSRNRLLERLVEQSEELRLSRQAEERARAAEQRARIGRDVHDVVAHSVSLIVVQAEAGEAQLGHDHPSAECSSA